MVLETRNYLKYVFPSFLGREEEKLVSKKLLQVHNSPLEPRSSFHLSLQPVLPSGHNRLHPSPSLQPRHQRADPKSQPWQETAPGRLRDLEKPLGGSSSCNEF